MPRRSRPETAALATGPDTPPLDLQQLRCFVAVADELNFTRAAARVGIVQSALSHQIAAMERDLRITLFERTSRSVRLAPGGQLLLPKARRILRALQDAQDELAALAGVVTGQLRVGLAAAAADILAPALAAFHRRHPTVELRIDQDGDQTLIDRVRRGDLDLAGIDLPVGEAPEDLTYHPSPTQPLVAVSAQTDNPTSRQDAPVDLAALGPLVQVPTQQELRRHVEDTLTRAGVRAQVAFEAPNLGEVLRYVALGAGSAIVPRSAASVPAGRTDLLVRPIDDPAASCPIGLVHRSKQPAAPAGRAFLSIVTDGPDLDPAG